MIPISLLILKQNLPVEFWTSSEDKIPFLWRINDIMQFDNIGVSKPINGDNDSRLLCMVFGYFYFF